MGFLNEQSLKMIVSVVPVPRDIYTSSSFSFPEPLMAMSMPFKQSGLFRKIIIAALFNATASAGWPRLQVTVRRASNETPYVVAFSTHIMKEPKPTGYLNVYEYDVSTQKFIIQTGDILNISWYGSPLQQNQTQDRFSLAYYRNATIRYPGIPMIAVFVDTNVTMYHEEVDSMQSTKSGITTNSDRVVKKSTTSEVIVISGVVSCSLLLSVLIISVSILVIRQRIKKRFSIEENNARLEVEATSTGEVIEVGANEAYITNDILTKSNVAYSTLNTVPHNYDYVTL